MMRKILFSLFILCCSISFGQSEEEMKKWTAYMTPSEIHLELAKNTGLWDTENTMWMTPGGDPTVTKGTMENTMVLGGRYQQSKYTSDFNGQPMEGIGTLAYDNETKEYTSTWIDNFGTGMMILKGKKDEKTGVLHLSGEVTDIMTDASTTKVRETFTIIDENTQKMEMFFEHEGKEFLSMRLIFRRRLE